MARRREAGFTLVELLVVIGIAAVMIAMLIPTLGVARRQARTLVCLSNVRQLGDAYHVYLNQNQGQSFEYTTNRNGFWMQLLKPLSKRIDLVSICPEAVDRSMAVGSTTQSWEVFGDQGSYTFNGWLYQYDLHDPMEMKDAFGPHSSYIPLPASNIDGIPVFSDGTWAYAWPHATDALTADDDEAASGRSPSEMSRVCINRHRETINIAFLDGHGETVPLSDLSRQRWSNAFIPQTTKTQH